MVLTYTVGAGNREDLTDIVSRITPEETPVLSSLRVGKACKATYHEWQMDKLADSTTQGTVEGSDNSSYENHAADRARAGNYTQITRRTWNVSDTQEAVDVAGVPSEIAEAKMKKSIEIKLDMENTICSGNDRNAGSSSIGRQLRGLFTWIDSAGPADVNSNYRTPSGSINADSNAITEDEFNGLCQSIWQVGGDLETFVVGATLKRTVSAFQGPSQAHRTIGMDEKKIVNSVSIYETDFGPMKMVPSRHLFGTTTPGVSAPGTNDGLFLSKRFVEINYLRSIANKDLPDNGGGKRGQIEVEYTISVLNPRALGKHTNSA
jgi:hypothetical protein